MDAFQTMSWYLQSINFRSTTIIAAMFFSLINFVAAQAPTSSTISTNCGGRCYGKIEISVVLVGRTEFAVSSPTVVATNTHNGTVIDLTTYIKSSTLGETVTRTVPCDEVSFDLPATAIYYTGCAQYDTAQVTSAFALDDGEVFASASVFTFIDTYWSIGQVMYGSSCISISTMLKINPPITIGAPDAYATAVMSTFADDTFTTMMKYSELVLDTTLWQSIGTACETPAAWLQGPTPTSIGSRPASTFLPESSGGLTESSRVVVGVTLVVGTCLLLGFLAIFIWRRRSYKKSSNKSHIMTQDEGLSLTNSHGAAGRYSKIRRLFSLQRKQAPRSLQHSETRKAPLIMLSGLICGLALAIGHHFLYQNINGLPITDPQISQTWFLRVGNLLAILVKLSFTVSIGVAFVQLQWLKLSRAAFSVKDIDALSGVLMNISSLFDSTVWLRFPSLTLLATAFWLMSLTPIFTPGTLNVRLSPYQNTTYLQVPQLDFSNSTKWEHPFSGDFGGGDAIGSIAARQIALATAIGGQILPLSPYIPNGTYLLDFRAPALRCLNASNLAQETFNALYGSYGLNYLSTVYVPAMDTDPVGGLTTPSYIDTGSLDSCRIYFAIDYSNHSTNTKETYSVTECSLYNANYSTQFTFRDAKQEVSVLSVDYLESVSFRALQERIYDASFPPDFASPDEKSNQMASYIGMMAALNSVLVGSIKSHGYAAVADFTNVELLNFNYLKLSSDEFQSKLQELFQNMTISMLSNPEVHKNSTGASWIRVDDQVFLTSYVYNSLDLIITYGLAFIITEICILFGLYAVVQNNGYYQNRFSTFLRATRNESELRKLTSVNDDAAGSRSKALAGATVEFFQAQKQQDVWLKESSRQDTVYRRPLAGVKDDPSEI